LPVEQRAVVVLRVVHDWSEDDVAYALDIPVGTVKSRLSRALQSLRREVEDE
jgi:RNA polymerase sigma-70 factor (ECF subfamily)